MVCNGYAHFPDEEKFRVSSPIKLFEYLASGLPLMATRIRCHTDVIQDNDVVFWMDGADVPDIIHALTQIGKRVERLPVMSADL